MDPPYSSSILLYSFGFPVEITLCSGFPLKFTVCFGFPLDGIYSLLWVPSEIYNLL